jgi:hypothetical protein
VLRGAYGVDVKTWSGTEFGKMPTSFYIRCGVTIDDCGNNDQVTKEYEVCLKCHSNFAYPDSGAPDGDPLNGRPPYIRPFGIGENVLHQYTNQAMEFQAPALQMGETNSMTGSGADTKYDTATHYNHRSWHPVIDRTKRYLSNRSMTENPWSAPFADVGNQTMLCSDCHNNGDPIAGVGGPHGSQYPKLLRAAWDHRIRWTDATPPFCKDCHVLTFKENGGYDDKHTGFKHGHDDVLTEQCAYCHIAIPHGWKNKSFLVNLDDLGPESLCHGDAIIVGRNTSSTMPDSTSPSCTVGDPIEAGTLMQASHLYLTPYYNRSSLGLSVFRDAGAWDDKDCGNEYNGSEGEGWMDEDGACPD